MDGTLVLWYYDMLGWEVEKLVLTYHLNLHVYPANTQSLNRVKKTKRV